MRTILLPLSLILLASCSKPSVAVKADAELLHTVLSQYQTEYGVYPSGDTLAIMQALKGANARHIAYVETPPGHTAPDGTLLDPWGTPYRIDYPTPDSNRVTSAGPDRKFDTGDDIQDVHPPVSPTPSR